MLGYNKSSLVVQWLGLSAFTAVAWVQALVRELRSHKLPSMAKKKKKKKKSNSPRKGILSR